MKTIKSIKDRIKLGKRGIFLPAWADSVAFILALMIVAVIVYSLLLLGNVANKGAIEERGLELKNEMTLYTLLRTPVSLVEFGGGEFGGAGAGGPFETVKGTQSTSSSETTSTGSGTYRGMPVSVGFKTPNSADRFQETTPVSVSKAGGPPYFISYVESEKTKKENVIALTYDLCSANSGFDKELVDYLIQNKIPATFFTSSKWINDGHEKDLKYLIDAGIFTIASHSKTHDASGNAGNGIFKDKKTTKERMISEFEDPHNLLKKYGIDNKICRLPVAQPWSMDAIGNLEFLKDATQYCQDFIQYDIWVTEGTRASADTYASSVLNHLKSGRASIILSHAGHPDWHNKEGVALLVQKLKDKNYKFVAIPDLLDNYAPSTSAGTSTAGTVSSAGGGEAKPTVTMTAEEKQRVDRLMQYDEFIRKYSEKYGIGANVVRAMIAWESGGKPDAISYTGAVGLGQFTFKTAEGYSSIFGKPTDCNCGPSSSSKKDCASYHECNAQNDGRFNPEKNIEATAKYLSGSYKAYDGSIYLIAISYNAGPGVANIVKSSLGDKLPTYENIRPLLDAAVLKYFKNSKIKEVDTHMKMVARYYEIFESMGATPSPEVPSTGAVTQGISGSTTVADLINIYAMEKDSAKAKEYQTKLVERIGFILDKAYGQGKWAIAVELPGNSQWWSTGASAFLPTVISSASIPFTDGGVIKVTLALY